LRTFYRQKLLTSIAAQLVWPYSGDPNLNEAFLPLIHSNFSRKVRFPGSTPRSRLLMELLKAVSQEKSLMGTALS
jgi:hypothetical protein